jgi:hypothetical protein
MLDKTKDEACGATVEQHAKTRQNNWYTLDALGGSPNTLPNKPYFSAAQTPPVRPTNPMNHFCVKQPY